MGTSAKWGLMGRRKAKLQGGAYAATATVSRERLGTRQFLKVMTKAAKSLDITLSWAFIISSPEPAFLLVSRLRFSRSRDNTTIKTVIILMWRKEDFEGGRFCAYKSSLPVLLCSVLITATQPCKTFPAFLLLYL